MQGHVVEYIISRLCLKAEAESPNALSIARGGSMEQDLPKRRPIEVIFGKGMA